MCGSNRMALQPTHLVVHLVSSEKCFLGMLRGDIGWPLHSPDLTLRDFFLWGYLKAQVYLHRPQTLEALGEAITQEDAAIPPEMIRQVMRNYRERLNECIVNEGRHLSNVLFKTH